jgi:hypothetical protein
MTLWQRILGRKPSKLPNYVYISDTKVDMLFGSIPRSHLNKAAAKLKMSFGVIETEVTIESEKSADHRVQRLQIVLEYLRENHSIGTVEAPDEYIEDALNMKWASIDQAVFFGGKTDRTVVGLGGSVKHVVGAGVGSAVMSASYANVLLRYLAEAGVKARSNAADPSLGVVESAVASLEGPNEPLRFFAEPLLTGPSTRATPSAEESPRGRVLLATPLFVARAWGLEAKR